MLIPVILTPSSPSNPKLPSCLAKISHDEVVLIELQGSLEVESNHPSERDDKHVGRLKIDEATNKPTLIIGHHLLEGKIQPLPKPLAVIVRSSKPHSSVPRNDPVSGADDDTSMLVDGKNDGDGVPGLSGPEKTGVHDLSDHYNQERPSGSTEGNDLEEPRASWAIVAVVKKKIIFAKRPMPTTNKSTK